MSRPVLSIAAGSVLFAILGCSGLTGGGSTTASAPTDKLRVGDEIKQKGKGKNKRPSKRQLAKSVVPGQYVVKLRAESAKGLSLKSGTLSTGDRRLDNTFKGLSASHARSAVRTKPKKSSLADAIGLSRTVQFSSDKDQAEVIKQLEAEDGVEWVEPMVKVAMMGNAPNDPYYERQWHMQRLDVTTAWETSQGEGTVVAVIDTGVSAGEDGYFKVLQGYDFIGMDDDPADEQGHGSHVAGTIGQATDNGIGTAGVAPKVSILPVRVLDEYGGGTAESVANGIVWAADNGADIINMSLGSSSPMQVVADACDYAIEQGVVIFASSGNDGFTDAIGYPAAYDGVNAIGALDYADTVTFYSNQGPELALVAPGGDNGNDLDSDGFGDGVLQETQQYGEWAYHYFNGTSMSCPHVSGAAALVHASGITDPYDLVQALTTTAKDLGPAGWDKTYGNGLVDPVAAMKYKPGKGGEKLKLVKSSFRKVGDQRAVIGWTTNLPSSSRVKGEDGFDLKEATKITQHRVTVNGKPGSTVSYKIGGSDGKQQVRDAIEVTF